MVEKWSLCSKVHKISHKGVRMDAGKFCFKLFWKNFFIFFLFMFRLCCNFAV